MPEISVQLYSVREQAKVDYEKTLRSIAEIGFTCVEPAGYPGSSPQAAAQLFQELGLKAPSCHGQLPVGDKKQEVLEQALMMGHEAIITGCPPNFQQDYSSLDRVRALADLYTEAAENTRQHGIQVGYHNHDWDLIQIDNNYAYREFLKRTPESVLWEADIFWIARAGLNVVDFIEELGVRGRFLHFKDGVLGKDATFESKETEDGKIMVSSDSPFLPAGKGQVDLLAASVAAQFADYIVVELDSYRGDMMEAIAESYQYLTGKGIAKGRK